MSSPRSSSSIRSHGVEGVDQPGVVVVERAVRDTAETRPELRQLRVRPGRAHPVGDDHPGKRPDPVHAVRVADRLAVGRLQERQRLDRLADVVAERFAGRPGRGSCRRRRRSPAASRRSGRRCRRSSTRRHEGRGEVAEDGGLVGPVHERRLVPGDRPLDRGQRLGDCGQDPVARLRRERRVDAAGHDPRRVDPLAAEPLDDLLAEPAQRRSRRGRAPGSPEPDPMMLRVAGSASKPNRRSGDDRWKKLSAFDWTIWARFITRRRSTPVGGGSTARICVARPWPTRSGG